MPNELNMIHCAKACLQVMQHMAQVQQVNIDKAMEIQDSHKIRKVNKIKIFIIIGNNKASQMDNISNIHKNKLTIINIRVANLKMIDNIWIRL